MTLFHPGKISLRLKAVLALACLAGSATAQKPAIPDGILMVGHDDPRFIPILTATFPSVAADPDFKKMLPILYLVRNDSDVAVRAFSVRWERTDPRPTARTNKPVGFYDEVLARPSQPSPLTGELPVLQPHRTQLMIPATGRFAPPGETDWFTPAIRPFAPFVHNDPDLEQEGAGEVKFSGVLSYVLMDDGRSGGPDTQGLGARLGALRAAERDEGMAVVSLLNEGAGADKIKALLQHDPTDGDHYSAPTKLLSAYEGEKRMAARRLMILNDRGMQDDLQKQAHTLAAIDPGPFSVAAERHRANAPMLSKYEAADIVVSGQIHPGDGSCPRPGSTGMDTQSCVAYLKIGHNYKGPEREGEDLRVEYEFSPRSASPVGMLASNEFFLFLGCRVGSSYQLCPNSGPMHMSPVVSASSTAKGLDLLAADAVAGLSSPKERDIFWSEGVLRAFDIQIQIDKLKAAKAAVTLTNALFLDDLLVRGGDYADATPDLELAMSMPDMKNNPGLSSLVQGMSAAPTPAMDEELPLLAKSPRIDMRQLALKLLQLHPEGTSISMLRDLLDDPEPTVAFSATKVLESRTGMNFKDKPGSFAQFLKDLQVRAAYIQEWKDWIASSGAN